MEEKQILLSSSLFKSNVFSAFLFTLGCFLFTYFYFGFYYVEYEGLFDSFYSGKLTEGLPFRSIYFLGNIGTSHFYSWLYEIWPSIEWISWILYAYQFVSCFLGLYIISVILPENFPGFAKLAVQTFVYLLIFADQHIHFVFTRVSYMVSGIALVALLHFFRIPNSIKERPFLFILLNLWFAIGTLTRSESATAAFLQIGIFGLFYLQNLRRFLFLFAFPFLFLFSLLTIIGYDLKTSTEFYKQVEPEIEAQFCERENMIELDGMKSYQDSMKWKAAKNILWSDPKIITPTFMRSLIRPEKLIYTDLRQWKRVWRDITGVTYRFWYLAIMGFLLSLLVRLQMKLATIWRNLLWLGFSLSFWVLIVLQTYTVKVNDRSFSPLISLFIFSHLLMLLPSLKTNLYRISYTILALIVILGVIHLCDLKAESNQLQKDLTEYQKNFKTIKELATGKILVVNSSSCDYLFLSNKPFHTFNFSDFKKVYITDGFNIPFLPYYRRYLEKECSCNMNDFPSFWDYLRTRSAETIIVSATQRIDILKAYLIATHGYDLPLIKNETKQLLRLQKDDARGIFADLTVYTVGK